MICVPILSLKFTIACQWKPLILKRFSQIPYEYRSNYIIYTSNVYFKGSSPSKEIAETVNLTSSKELVIIFPGNLSVNYPTGKTYKWLVTAPSSTEEILVKIKMDIRKPNFICQDFLQVCVSKTNENK